MSWKTLAAARDMMLESESLLRPLLEKYRPIIDPKVWEQYEDGCVAGIEVLQHTFERHTTEEEVIVSPLN
jgi:hypothetical protein